MAPNRDTVLNPHWVHSATGKLAQEEFAFQRMHRTPKDPPPPPSHPDLYTSSHAKSFPDRGHNEGMPPSAASTARYTVGTKNALGTHVNYKQVSLDEMKMSSVHLGEYPRTDRFTSTFSSAFSKPDQSHGIHGVGSMRGGMAPRLPFSEIERNFGSLTSEGTMPGADGKRELTSEQGTQYANPGRQPRVEPTLTLGFGNDIGTSATYQPSPAILANVTHYTLGDEPRRYQTTAMSATAPHAPPAARSHVAPAGQKPPPGPSEVEQGFKQTFTSSGFPVAASSKFNILTNGPRLLGEHNSDAKLFARNSAAHDQPVGKKQHPTVNPMDRGPSGMRQTYDIINGLDRPRERW